MHERGREVLEELLEGNVRFRSGSSRHRVYSPSELNSLATTPQKPVAAIIACSDSRITPEIIFDQPLGTIFSSRVPGNVASDGAKWTLELALDLHVPLIIVMGHSGCLAVGEFLDGDKGGAGGLHRASVLSAVNRAKSRHPHDLHLAAVEENVHQTIEHLVRDLHRLDSAVQAGSASIVGAVYEMQVGLVRPIT